MLDQLKRIRENRYLEATDRNLLVAYQFVKEDMSYTPVRKASCYEELYYIDEDIQQDPIQEVVFITYPRKAGRELSYEVVKPFLKWLVVDGPVADVFLDKNLEDVYHKGAICSLDVCNKRFGFAITAYRSLWERPERVRAIKALIDKGYSPDAAVVASAILGCSVSGFLFKSYPPGHTFSSGSYGARTLQVFKKKEAFWDEDEVTARQLRGYRAYLGSLSDDKEELYSFYSKPPLEEKKVVGLFGEKVNMGLTEESLQALMGFIGERNET